MWKLWALHENALNYGSNWNSARDTAAAKGETMRYACLVLIAFAALSASAALTWILLRHLRRTLSAMFSLEDIYNRLNASTPGVLRTGGFTNPTTGPIATQHTLNDVMGKAPASDNASGATAAQVLSGKTYWSLQSAAWGTAAGTMPDNGAVSITPRTASQTIALGFHNGAGTVAGERESYLREHQGGQQHFWRERQRQRRGYGGGHRSGHRPLVWQDSVCQRCAGDRHGRGRIECDRRERTSEFLAIPDGLYSGGKTATGGRRRTCWPPTSNPASRSSALREARSVVWIRPRETRGGGQYSFGQDSVCQRCAGDRNNLGRGECDGSERSFEFHDRRRPLQREQDGHGHRLESDCSEHQIRDEHLRRHGNGACRDRQCHGGECAFRADILRTAARRA